MKRRNFGLMVGGSVIAMQAAGQARAQIATQDASQLGTTLTPLGSEKAGNADGSIPAWTGGLTTMPSGLQPGDFVPELFPDEQPVVTVDASNMASHAALLTEGVQAMMTKYQGFKINVYPTHRTAAAPQRVYDCIKANVATAKFTDSDPTGGRFGFEGAFGGIPFPIPDQSNPSTAGGQIIWNSNTSWIGYADFKPVHAWCVSDGQLSLAYMTILHQRFPYYIATSLDEFNGRLKGLLYQENSPYSAPANLVGQNIIVYAYANPHQNPQIAWELLNGQGRVRRAPEISFDTPSSQANGICGYDEYYGFNGSLERYDWKLLGRQEVYVPYNNNKLYAANPHDAHLSHFVDPDLVRFEKHRCWVVEATLHPGERNVLSRRKIYVDEDTYQVCLVDAWDSNGNLFKVNYVFNLCNPGLPGVVFGNNAVYNLQTGDYATIEGPWNKIPFQYVADIDTTLVDPANMAASAQY